MAINKNPGIEKTLDKNKFYPTLTLKKLGFRLFVLFLL